MAVVLGTEAKQQTGPGGGLGVRVSPKASSENHCGMLVLAPFIFEAFRVLYKAYFSFVISTLRMCQGSNAMLWGLAAGAAGQSLPRLGVWPAPLQDEQEEATVTMKRVCSPLQRMASKRGSHQPLGALPGPGVLPALCGGEGVSN